MNTMPATVIERSGIRQYETTYNGWKLFAWEFNGSWRVTAELYNREHLRHGICWGGGDKMGMWAAIDDAKSDIDSGNIQWTQYRRDAAGNLHRM
jgi:hypothetical protein